jgi:hypothetical protein
MSLNFGRGIVMKRLVVTCTLGLELIVSAPACADPSICVHSLTDIEILSRVRQDAYFTRNAPLSRHLRMDYDYPGCGYRIHVGEHSPASHDGDLLLVDRTGRVTRIVHQHR